MARLQEASMTKTMSKPKKTLLTLFILGVIYTIIILIRSVLFYQQNILPTQSNAAENKANNINHYPFDIGFCQEQCKTITTDFVTLDDNKVYVVDYSKIKNLRGDDGTHYMPLTIGLYSLAHHSRFLRYNKAEDEQLFISNSNWLRDNLNEDGCWIFHFNLMNSKAPWCSGMAQGLGLSALVRAYNHTQDQSYLDAAMQALRPFALDNKFTVTYVTDDGYHFYEETSARDEPIHILNGFLFAMIGLYDLHQQTQLELVGEYYNQAVRTLHRYNSEFETGNWSLYSLDPNSNLRNHYRYASPSYQRLHVIMFQAMYDMTGEKHYQEAYLRHLQYLESSWINFIIIPAYLTYQDLSWTIKTVRNLI